MSSVELASFVKDIGIELHPWQESILVNLPDGTMQFDFGMRHRPMYTWDDLHPETQAYFRRLMAEVRARRLSRMRSAYRARRR